MKKEKSERDKQIDELKKEMRKKGIRITSCMNGGLSGDEYRYNTRLMALKWSK